MEVHLKNFRCWEDKTVRFEKHGITLLHGGSGMGKSSILEGICFGITGAGRNIVSQGRSTCTVTVKFLGTFMITRKRHPNVLQVELVSGQTLVDDEAQSYIDTYLSSSFTSIGYLRQGGKNESFVVKTPLEKLRFLESIAFSGVSVSNLKMRTKSLIKEWDMKASEISQDISFHEGRLEELKDIKEPNYPLKSKPQATDQAKAKAKLQKIRKALVSLEEMISTKEKELESRRTGETSMKYIDSMIKQTTTQKSTSKSRLEKVPLSIETDLACAQRELKMIKGGRELRVLENTLKRDVERLNDIKRKEDEELDLEISELKSSIWPTQTLIEASASLTLQREAVARARQCENIERSLNSLKYTYAAHKSANQKQEKYQRSLTTLEKRLERAAEQRKIRKCPSCDCDLRIEQDMLVLADDVAIDEREIEKLKHEQGKILLKFSTYQSKSKDFMERKVQFDELTKRMQALKTVESTEVIPGQIAELEEYLTANRNLQRELEKLERRKSRAGYSATVNELEHSVTHDQARLNDLKGCIDHVEGDEDTLSERISELTLQKQNRESELTSIARYDTELDRLAKERISLLSNLPAESAERLARELNHYKIQKKKARSSEMPLYKLVQQLSSYQEAQSRYDSKTQTVSDILKLSADKSLSQDRSHGAALLESKIRLVESQCLSNFVLSLQRDVQDFLTDFFPENELIVSIKCFKEVKKVKKPEINILMYYKGLECDYTSLSGGELQRVILAFTLALSLRSNLPLVMLDECTSNLDESLTNVVVQSIKGRLLGRPIIMIAHQVVKGLFDNVIEV